MAKKRTTIGVNPLDSVIPSSTKTQNVHKGGNTLIEDSTRKASNTENNCNERNELNGEKACNVRITFNLPEHLIEKARDAAYWDRDLTLTKIASDGIEDYLKRLEKKRGEKFPERSGRLNSGRPIKK